MKNLNRALLLSFSILMSSASFADNQSFHFFGFGKKEDPQAALSKINSTNPQLAKLWNSTSLILGAAADGIGIGTTFAVKKDATGNIFFLTSFSVIEHFCDIPEAVENDLTSSMNLKYPCKDLFVLHDLAIDTATNAVAADGAQPWKSEVLSIEYFDKKRNLAAFRLSVPQNSNIEPATLELDYSPDKLLVVDNNAEKLNPKLPVADKHALTEFALYMPAYTIPTPPPAPAPVRTQNFNSEEDSLAFIQAKPTPAPAPAPETMWIRKHWFKGSSDGIRTYENDKKLGFVDVLNHNIEARPGSTGGPLALSDGRVIGFNSSVEVTQFFSQTRSWFSWKSQLETHKAFIALPSIFVKDVFDKIN